MDKARFSWRKVVVPEILLTAGLYGLLSIVFAVFRLLLLWRNGELAASVPPATLAESFLVGLRFDLAICSYLLIPLFLLLLVVRGRLRAWALGGFVALCAGIVLLGLAEVEFFRELEMRFNQLVFEYLSHPRIVGGMIWDGYPVGTYLLIWTALVAFLGGGLWWLQRRLPKPAVEPSDKAGMGLRGVVVLVFLALMVFASRGGFGHEPLRWGDAFFSRQPFANQLALNGLFTLGRSAWDEIYGTEVDWTEAMPEQEALAATQEMLMTPGETDLSSERYPLLREEKSAADDGFRQARAAGEPVNVVVILMESFSGRHVGALGAGRGLTPEFDRLSKKGILFERAFSNGTHTHQGVFAALASFPNLPGYEYLMKMMEANQEFSGLPTLLDEQGYQSVFLYNGLFSWDNKEGFFRQHGIHRFIGTEDYRNPSFRDPVWGVSDYDVFMRANEEFSAMAEKGPFFGAVLTLSNHSPFNLPENLPFERIQTGSDRDARYNAMRYADWALGQFFRRASREPYFDNTLFVLTGDHGFGVPPAISDMHLEAYHVPLLFYGPGVLGSEGERRATVASQVDIGASVLGLLGLDVPHQSWGRNLFSPGLEDEGFAVIKPSGGHQQVALIEGDYLLMEAPEEAPRLYRYDLGFPPQAEPLEASAVSERLPAMRHRLEAFIETGILALQERRLGTPDSAAGEDATASAALPGSEGKRDGAG